jgi:hypothetical protein
MDLSIDQIIQGVQEAQESGVYHEFEAPSYHLPDDANTSSSSDGILASTSPYHPEVSV